MLTFFFSTRFSTDIRSCDARLGTVSRGTFEGKKALLLSMSFDFHPANPNKHRFKRVTVEIRFSPYMENVDRSPRIIAFAPRLSYAAATQSSSTATWAAEIAHQIVGKAGYSNEKTIQKTDVMVLQGSCRGDTKLVWTANENSNAGQGMRGIVDFDTRILLICEEACHISVFLDADIGWRFWDLEKYLPEKYWPIKSKGSLTLLDPENEGYARWLGSDGSCFKVEDVDSI